MQHGVREEPASIAYKFGDWLVEPQLNRISRNGENKHLEPKSAAVLEHLLERHGEVVSMDALLDAVWADRVVEPNALHRHITRLRQALEDDAHEPRFIETVSKRGYRAIAPVQRLAPEHASNPPVHGDRKTSKLGRLAFGILGAAIVSVGVWWFIAGSANRDGPVVLPSANEQMPTAALPNSVAVLPLQNLSPDPANAYFAAGLHEEILNQLVKVQDISVIARTSVQKYAGATSTIPEIAKELNVQSVLEGSVRYADNRVRVTAQLVDASTGLHLWSNTYDRSLDDIFSIQAEIAAQIAASLGSQLSEKEKLQIEALPTKNMEAYLLYVQALSMLQDFPPLDPVHAKLDQAIGLDPMFAQAIGLKAFLYTQQASTSLQHTALTPEKLDRYHELASASADQALAMDPSVATAYLARAAVAESRLRVDDALAAAATAYQLNPNAPFVRLIYARALAIRRSPDAPRLLELTLEHDPQNAGVFLAVSRYYSEMGNPTRAYELKKQVVALAPEVALYHAELATWESRGGDAARALHHAERAEALHQESTPLSTLDAQIYYQLLLCYLNLDRPKDAMRLLSKLESMATGVIPELLGGAYMAVGEIDKAVEQFRRALDEGYPWIKYELAFNRNHPKFDSIREHPGFRAMLEEVRAAY